MLSASIDFSRSDTPLGDPSMPSAWPWMSTTGYFARGTGAFGCQADARDDLLRLALWRSACTPRRAVLVTDVSRDVCGLTVVAIRSLAELPALLSERHAA